MSQKEKVLIQWLGGDDDGKLDIVDASWVKNFDPTKWKSSAPEDRDESEVVEWRVGKKSASGFYVSYDAKVLGVDSKASVLNALKAEVEKKSKEDDNKRKGGDLLHEKEPKEPKKSKEGDNKRKGGDLLHEKEPKEPKKSKEDDSKRKGGDMLPEKEPKPKKSKASHPAESDDSSSESDSSEAADNLKSDPDHSDLSDQIEPKAKGEDKKKADNLTLQKIEKKKIKGRKLPGKGKQKTENDEAVPKVPIHKGSPYYVDRILYEHSKKQPCASFVTAMLHALFKTHVLVVSNIRGGTCKNSSSDGLRRWALDAKKRKAIVTAALTLHPSKDQAAIHALISRHINSLRFRLKKAGKLAKYEEKGARKMGERPHTSQTDSELSSTSDSGEE